MLSHVLHFGKALHTNECNAALCKGNGSLPCIRGEFYKKEIDQLPCTLKGTKEYGIRFQLFKESSLLWTKCCCIQRPAHEREGGHFRGKYNSACTKRSKAKAFGSKHRCQDLSGDPGGVYGSDDGYHHDDHFQDHLYNP